MADITFWGEDAEFSHDNEIGIFDKLLECRNKYVNTVVDLERDKKLELQKRKNEWDEKLSDYRNERDSFERNRIEDMNREIEIFKQQKEERKKEYSEAFRILDNQIDEIKRKLDVLNKLKQFREEDAGKLLKAKKCFLDAVTELDNMKQQLTNEYENDKNEILAAYDKNIKNIEDSTEGNIDQIDKRKKDEITEYDAFCKDIELRYSEKLEGINKEYEQLIRNNFSEKHISDYNKGASRYMISGDNYVCPSEVSRYIHFGSISVNIDKAFENTRGFDRLFLEYAKDIVNDENKKVTLSLAYIQSFKDGVSLIIKHNDSQQVKDCLKDIVLKTLMYYPAGKAVVTMIDPKGLGGSFSGLGRLGGDKDTWLRDTKIWSDEKEIEAALNRFRETAENWIQIYGGDKEALIEKEQIKILAIMDFPGHFSERALDALSAVMRNCRNTGTIIYIMTGKKEFEKLIESYPERHDDFNKCVVLEQVGKSNDFIIDGHKRDHIMLQGLATIRKNADQIINTISMEADEYQPPVVPFSTLYKADMLDSNNWFTENPSSFSVPIGYHSFNAPMSLSFGAVNDTKQNVLIEGMPRSGKTNLLHNIILGGLLNYNPQYLQFYLIDFKDGVEFREYADYYLPGIKVIAVDAQREFALSILEELVDEMTRRNNEFGRVGANDIDSYNENIDATEIMPRLMLIFDEVTSLFNNSDHVSEACLDHIMKIQTKGGNVGIHTILATQDYNQCTGVNVDRDFSLAKIRIVTFGRDDTTCSILKSTDGMAIGRIGSALFNDNGGEAANNRYLRVATSKREALPENEPCRQDYLEKLDEYYNMVSDIYSEYETHIWTNTMEKNPNIYFNRLLDNVVSEDYLPDIYLVEDEGIGMLVGNGIRDNYHVITLSQEEKENILMMSSSEAGSGKMMESVIISMLLSIVCECAVKQYDDARVYVIDGSVRSGSDRRDKNKVRLSDLSALFDIIDYYRGRDDGLWELLSDISEEIDSREKRDGIAAPIYLFINKIDDMEFIFDDESTGKCRDLFYKILENGPEVNVHVVMTGEYYDVVVSGILGDKVNDFFNKRIAIHLDDSNEQFHLVYRRELSESGHADRLAIMYDRISVEAEVDMFSVYDMPDYSWIEQISYAINP